VYVSLEPIGAPKAGFAMLQRLATTIAKNAHGVIFDPQAVTVETPSGIKRFTPAKKGTQKRIELLEMSWWFEHSRILEAAWLDSFLSLLETHLPEAVPRRYGLTQPLQYTYAKTGRDHLVEFLRQNLTEFVLWDANKPVFGWTFSADPTCGWLQRGATPMYRCNWARVEIDAAALQHAGWPTALRRFWQKASLLFEPFFGEVRTLHGWTEQLTIGGESGLPEQAPNSAGGWRGVPPRLGHAVVVGDPYVGHWPQLEAVAEKHDGLLFLSTDDWSSSEDAADLVGGVPAAIALPFMPHWHHDGFGGSTMVDPDTYPEVFPFGDIPPGVTIWNGEMPPGVSLRKKPWWRFWDKRC